MKGIQNSGTMNQVILHGIDGIDLIAAESIDFGNDNMPHVEHVCPYYEPHWDCQPVTSQ